MKAPRDDKQELQVRINTSRLTLRTAILVLGVVVAWGAPTGRSVAQPAPADALIAELIQEAIANNPEIAAARSERDAAQQRIAYAGALDDPMLEVDVINVPQDTLRLDREDMTMKVLGLSQKLPFPGKRDLRRAVAAANAESLDLAAEEVSNRIVRDLRVAYEELALNEESQRILGRVRAALEQLVVIARSRYDVGEAVQADVLDAQTELDRLQVEQHRLTREYAVLQSDIRRLLGRKAVEAPLAVTAPVLSPEPASKAELQALAIANRPQLLALQSVVARNSQSIALAQREYYPDFDLKLEYGQRERTPEGLPRDDLVSLTVSLNLPIWRKSRLAPQVAEARAMRAQAESMLVAQQFETWAELDTQLALAKQWRDTADLYQHSLLPQVRATSTSVLAAYRVGRVDFLTLRLAQMREFEIATGLVAAIANHNKAVAEVDLLVGRQVP